MNNSYFTILRKGCITEYITRRNVLKNMIKSSPVHTEEPYRVLQCGGLLQHDGHICQYAAGAQDLHDI